MAPGWQQNYVYYNEYTYEDLVKALEDLFTEKPQDDFIIDSGGYMLDALRDHGYDLKKDS